MGGVDSDLLTFYARLLGLQLGRLGALGLRGLGLGHPRALGCLYATIRQSMDFHDSMTSLDYLEQTPIPDSDSLTTLGASLATQKKAGTPLYFLANRCGKPRANARTQTGIDRGPSSKQIKSLSLIKFLLLANAQNATGNIEFGGLLTG